MLIVGTPVRTLLPAKKNKKVLPKESSILTFFTSCGKVLVVLNFLSLGGKTHEGNS